MSLRKYFLLFLLLPSIVCAEWGDENDFLESQDVNSIMKEILTHHVKHNSVTTEVIRRSFELFIDQFDSSKSYLISGEIERYMEPSDSLLRETLRRYQSGDVSTYVKLNAIIQRSIRRAREIREEIEEELPELFARAKELSEDEEVEKKEGFAASEEELRERIREQLTYFIQYQMVQIGKKGVEGKEQAVIDLYERNLRADENKYIYIDKEGMKMPRDRQEHFLVLHALQAIAKSLDAHTSFFSYAEAYDMKIRLEKGFKGVGIVLQESIDGVTITRLIDGGPAKRSEKIEDNDRIVSVNGESIIGYSFDDVLDIIRGEEGSSVVLGLKRLQENETELEFDVKLVREQIEISEERVDVSWEPYADGIIGKITLHSFYDGDNGVSSVRDVRNAIRDLQKKGELKGLVFDMRENTGGFLMQAVKVAGLFISNGVVVVSKYSDGEMRYFRDIDGHSYYEGPLVVLTSRGSASAAEIVAQSLQDYGRALVIGDPTTYGKGSIQHQTVTDSNRSSYFKVTVGTYYTVSGKSAQIQGVKADIVVPTVMHEEELGERFLDYPLENDRINPSFSDTLADLDYEARRWYKKYYSPSVEKKESRWVKMLPQLRENSQYRLENDKNYQEFLENIGLVEDEEEDAEEEILVLEEGELSAEDENHGAADLQIRESINILKDMILLETLQ